MKIVIAGYVRTPFHFANKGQLAGVRPDDLAAILLRHLAVGLDPLSIEDVLIGCAYPEGEQGNNLARIAALLAGLPESIGGATINRFCGSSMSAIHYAAGQIALGCGEAFLCGGVESMSRVPRGGFSFTPNSLLQKVYVSMGQTAENVAAKYGITRLDQEQFALESQQKAGRARSSNGEMVAIGLVETDGCLRPQTTLEGLAQLKPAFGGSVTAGTASPLTDGAAMVLVCSEPYARSNRLEILASIRSMAVAGCPPELMGMGPVPATRKALARAGLAISDIDIFEVNEAFASQALACIRELEIPVERCNLDGGAIAIGHPLGATGARITGKAASLLRREGGRFALATQCIGGGQGIATVLEAWR